jgi:hypothetical protein
MGRGFMAEANVEDVPKAPIEEAKHIATVEEKEGQRAGDLCPNEPWRALSTKFVLLPPGLWETFPPMP